MPDYMITVTETTVHTYLIKADNSEAAMEKASRAWKYDIAPEDGQGQTASKRVWEIHDPASIRKLT